MGEKYGEYISDWVKRKLYISYAAPVGRSAAKKTPRSFKIVGSINYLESLRMGRGVRGDGGGVVGE